MLPEHTGRLALLPNGCAIAMLQVILQIFVDELEFSLSAIHPDDETVSEE
jgi:hypothetical protein